ncbi:MAG: hypothetical protein M1832_005892 [Thelocarpon impressellum]|nr:MAG: hypothetical protein M1832_005892 [Thelocarpon impressellum]
MAEVAGIYNTLLTLEEADLAFTKREPIFEAMTALLAKHDGSHGLCLVHSHCKLVEGEMMLATGNISQPVQSSDAVPFYPERWLSSGMPFELTVRPTVEPPTALVAEFKRIVFEVGLQDVLGLYHMDGAKNAAPLIEWTEERENLTRDLTEKDLLLNPVQTAWLFGRGTGDPVTMACTLYCDTRTTRSGGKNVHKNNIASGSYNPAASFPPVRQPLSWEDSALPLALSTLEAPRTAATLSGPRDPTHGSSVSAVRSPSPPRGPADDDDDGDQPAPRSPPASVASPESDAAAPSPDSSPSSSRPPPFSSLYFPASPEPESHAAHVAVSEAVTAAALGASAAPPFEQLSASSSAAAAAVAETKAALPVDTKGEASGKSADDGEPPPPYTEGGSPLASFVYLMAAAGGASSIITQVQQGGVAPINTLADVGADENINLDLRGTRFTLSRDELLTLPEFVLLSLFPNGLLPDGHMNSFHDGDVYSVDYDSMSLQYMLDFFRTVAQTIPSRSPSPTGVDAHAAPVEPMPGSAREMLQDRAGIIVLREDLDFYAIPPRQDIEQTEMIEVKRAAGKALLKQDGIFSGLRRSEESGTTEQHLIEMLTAGGFNNDDRWGHRASEPNKAVICSLALARLRTDVRGGAGEAANSNAVGMAQKLLLFWRKPARRCWWEGVELLDVEGVEGKLKVWIRRVWTLEMSVIGLR